MPFHLLEHPFVAIVTHVNIMWLHLRNKKQKLVIWCKGDPGNCCCVALVVSNSVRPCRWQPTRLPHPWDSPGKNTGVGCHFPLRCMKVKSESEVAQSCPTLATPWTAAYQAPPSMGFSRQKYWSGVPLPSLRKEWKKNCYASLRK